jgi:carbon storage regulator
LFNYTKEKETGKLALTRKVGESIVIGDDIVVTLINIGSNRVKLGIEAPQKVGVYRKEIYLQQQTEDVE